LFHVTTLRKQQSFASSLRSILPVLTISDMDMGRVCQKYPSLPERAMHVIALLLALHWMNRPMRGVVKSKKPVVSVDLGSHRTNRPMAVFLAVSRELV